MIAGCHACGGWAPAREPAIRRRGSELAFSEPRSGRNLFDDSSYGDRGVRKPSLLVQSPREVPDTSSHPTSTRICAGQEGCHDAISAGFQMSRKGPASAVTCHEGGLVADLREWPFSCFILMPVDGVGSPRRVPGDSHDRRPPSGSTGSRQRGGARAVRRRSALSSAGIGCALSLARRACLPACLGVAVQFRRAASAFSVFAAWCESRRLERSRHFGRRSGEPGSTSVLGMP